MQAKRIKTIIFFIVIGGLFLPIIQKTFKLIKIKPLAGFFHLTEMPLFSIGGWNEGVFQTQYSRYIEDHVGFRDFFIRLHNQIDFSLFHKPNGDGVIIGKNGNLFIQTYIDAYLGNDFIGKDAVDARMRKLRFLQDEFKKKNIDFVLVFAPGKASFYPEDIPEQFNSSEKKISNYEYSLQKCKDLNIHFLDFNKYFISLKPKSKYPLYPKFGTHLTSLGSAIVADSIVKYIEHVRSQDLPDVIWKEIFVSDTLRGSDYDISELINLFYETPNPPMAHPRFDFKNDLTKQKLNVLSVSDSYYMGLLASTIPQSVFNTNTFWEYNKYVYPDSWDKETTVDKKDLKTEIEKQNVVIIMSTEANLFNLSYGFIENAFEVYGPKTKEEKLKFYEYLISNDAEWNKEINDKAKAKNTTIALAIKEEAIRAYNVELPDLLKIKEERITFHENRIRANAEYMVLMIKKAKDFNLSVDEMIRKDAEWLYNEENKK